jgi:hypothetical protein
MLKAWLRYGPAHALGDCTAERRKFLGPAAVLKGIITYYFLC